MILLVFCLRLVAVGDVLGQVLGEVADAPVRVLGPGEHALGVEAVAEPGGVQRFVLVADGVERVIPGRQDFTGFRVEVGTYVLVQTGRCPPSKRILSVDGHHTWW